MGIDGTRAVLAGSRCWSLSAIVHVTPGLEHRLSGQDREPLGHGLAIDARLWATLDEARPLSQR
jgi:hypothetical protein